MAMKSTLSVNQPTLRHFNVYVAFVTLILISTPFVSAQDLEYPTKNGICKSMDIRNSLETFQKLKGCRVVEGFVQILLFDNVNETLLSNISFPELMEITDYLLLFRVNGLRSIGQLFPNLTVIRGQNSFFGYSFIVFEMSSLQEVALYSLSNITNGSIRIDKNPSLCFIKSIDWEKIVSPRDLEFNYINIMKPENECPICPGEELPKDDIVTIERPKICPTAPFKSKTVDFSRRRHLCWNRHHCQKICPRGCTACNNKDQCCHRDCLGGCADDNVNNCKVCRNFEVWEGSIRKCVDSCPNGTLEFLGRRCISHTECRKMPRPINLPSSKPFHPYNIYSNKCVLKCPVNMNVVKQRCVECDQGRCVKSCNGVNIDSIEIAKQLTGCTHITGSLEIQIRGGSNIVNLLEESLGMIEEIDGYLKVVRSFPLVSLNFLKSLKRIRGESLDSQKFVFVVLDNQNLQDLWDWKDGRTLKIDNGRLFFHFNPKLCLKEIRTLQNKTGIDPPFTELEVAISSNGDKIACDVRNLSVEVKKKMSKAVSLSWKPVLLEDQRNLLGYIVYSIQAKYRNVTLYDGRDACGGDGWRVDDVTIPEDHTPEVVHLLTQLKPYTQYAYYVKTYTIAKENIGAQSPIQYFRTEAEVPSPPLRLVVTSDGSDSLKITWSPPKDPNGNVTSYFITGKKRETLYDEYNTRNHCGELSVMPYQPSTEPPPKVVTPTVYNGTCSCDDKTKEPGINEDVQVERIDFENALHNEVYIRKDNTESRKRRDVYNTFPTIKNTLHNIENQGVGNVTKNGTVISFERTVYGKTDFSINKLHHFTYYDITIQACREKEHPKDDKICSYQAMESGRTLVRNGADNITRVYIINQTLESVTIKWNDLRDPNGMVFKYSIEYKRNNENSKASFDCITHKEWLLQEKTYTLKLSPGNYSLRVSAITAGNSGKYSPYVVFVIKEPNNVAVLALSIIIPIFILSCLSLLLCYRKYSIQKASMRLVPRVNPEYMSSAYVPDEWEIPRSNIQLIKELGQGSFGMVYEGTVTDLKGKNPKKCAVKTVNENSTDRERIDFLNEASVMKAFDTAHVVRLLGVVSEGQPTYVVMELMANGDLKSYLRSHRPDTENFTGTGRSAPTLKQILQMAIEIADGMAYLSAKKFVHRDLAARNCMVSENLVVKIGDFGMTRDIYETDYYRKGTKGLLPVRWMAPESLKDGVFTSASDAWSYGIVIWEMATLASQPYQGLSNDQVLRYVIDGGMMCKPENCPDKLYEIMKECWNHSALKRPSFIQLCTKLLCDASATFAEVSFFHSAAGLEARMSARPPPSPQDNPSTPLRKSGCLDKNYLLNNNSDDDSDSEIGTHLVFSSIMNFEHTDYRPSPIHANGYVSGCPTNGAATTQC